MSLSASEIDDLVRRYPLPDGVNDAVMNRTELAAFFGVTLTTISVWLNAGMPVIERGRQGSEYEMQASACFAWKQARDADEETRSREAQQAIEAMRLALVGGKPGDTELSLPPKERKQLYDLEITRAQMMRQRNELIQRDDVREMLETLFKIFINTVEAWPDNLDRTGQVEPKVVEWLVEECDKLQESFRHEIETYWQLRPVKERDREGLFDAA